METNRIIEFFKAYAISLVDESADWETLTLKIEIQPLVVGMSGKGKLTNGELFSLKTKFPEEVKTKISELHRKTIGINGENKWNRLNLIFYRNDSVEVFYEWDSVWQTEVDGFNREAEEEDKSYKAPKWFWEENNLS